MATSNAVPVFSSGLSGNANIPIGQNNAPIVDVAFLADGKIVAVSNGHFYRFNADGSADSTLDDDGILTMRFGPDGGMGWTDLEQVTPLANGKVIITGTISEDITKSGDTSLLLARLNADGSLDKNFNNGSGKIVWNAVKNGYEKVVAAEVLSDGRILVAASSMPMIDGGYSSETRQDIVLARYLPDGTPDASFGPDGIRVVGNTHVYPTEMIVQANGKILVTGMDTNTEPGYTRLVLFRYNSDGTTDHTFGDGGTVKTDFPTSTYNRSSTGQDVAVQADGKIVVVGSAPPQGGDERLQEAFAAVRYNQDGTLDKTFSADGKVAEFVFADNGTWRPQGDRAWGESIAYKLHLNDDGSIVIGGTTFKASFTTSFEMQVALVRLRADGTLDTSFGTKGYVTAAPAPVLAGSYASVSFGNLIVGLDGQIVVGGGVSIEHIGSKSFLTAFKPDGTLDGTFGATVESAQNSAVYLAGHPGQLLNAAITIKDADVDSANGGTYAGSHVTVARAGAAHPDDHFAASGALRFKDGKALLDGIEIGSVAIGAGTLRIDFNKAATQSRVNEALQSITYDHQNPAIAPRTLTVDWTFGDANASSKFSTVVNVESVEVPYWIDALLDRRVAGQTADQLRLQLQSLVGANKNINVQFDSTGSGSFSSPQRQLIDKLIGELDAATGLNFGAAGTSLRITNSVELAAGESAATPLSGAGAAALVAMTADNASFANQSAVLHALGHALGLKDGDRESLNGSVLPAEDYLQSAMNNGSGGALAYPGDLDIAALQFLYGPGATARPGNDLYLLSEATSNFIWDGAGNDTVSAAGLTADLSLHLAPGYWDYIGDKGRTITAAGQLTVNYGSVIENAIGGSGNDSISGTATANSLAGGAGNDRLEGLGGNDQIDGGAGIDTAMFSSLRSAFTVSREGPGFTVTDRFGSGGTDTLVNVERIAFSNGTLAIDLDGNAGQTYRMYKAVFGRDPDAGGLGYWIAAMDKGMSADTLARNFMASPEFASQYGPNPDTTRLVTTLYKNVLHREPDAAGFAWWQGLLDKGTISASEALTGFSESTENRAQVIGAIENGIAFTPFYG